MKRLKEILCLGFAVVVAAAIVVALTPKTAHSTDPTPVEVVNTVPVQDVDNPVRHAFQTALCAPVSSVSSCGSLPSSFTVPDGQDLVIENISGRCETVPSSGTLELGIVTTVSGTTVVHSLVPTLIFPSSASSVFSFNHITRIYADPNSNVTFRSFRVVNGLCSASVSGYLINP